MLFAFCILFLSFLAYLLFSVHNEWTVRPVTQAAQQGHEEGGEEFDNDDLLQQQKQQQQQAEIRSDVTIKLGVVFSKRTVLRGKVL